MGLPLQLLKKIRREQRIADNDLTAEKCCGSTKLIPKSLSIKFMPIQPSGSRSYVDTSVKDQELLSFFDDQETVFRSYEPNKRIMLIKSINKKRKSIDIIEWSFLESLSPEQHIKLRSTRTPYLEQSGKLGCATIYHNLSVNMNDSAKSDLYQLFAVEMKNQCYRKLFEIEKIGKYIRGVEKKGTFSTKKYVGFYQYLIKDSKPSRKCDFYLVILNKKTRKVLVNKLFKWKMYSNIFNFKIIEVNGSLYLHPLQKDKLYRNFPLLPKYKSFHRLVSEKTRTDEQAKNTKKVSRKAEIFFDYLGKKSKTDFSIVGCFEHLGRYFFIQFHEYKIVLLNSELEYVKDLYVIDSGNKIKTRSWSFMEKNGRAVDHIQLFGVAFDLIVDHETDDQIKDQDEYHKSLIFLIDNHLIAPTFKENQ